MKSIRFAAVAASLTLIFASLNIVLAEGSFVDVTSDSEFLADVQALSDAGIVGGISTPQGTMYYPLLDTSRAQLAKFIVNATQLPLIVSPGAPHFSDVPETNTLYTYIESAYTAGIIQGRSEGVFAPDAPVLRQEASKMIVLAFRAVDKNGYFAENTTGGPHFEMTTSNEFYSHIETLYNLGIIRGYGNGIFGGTDSMRRDQMARIINGALTVLRNGPPQSPVGAPVQLRLEALDSSLYPDTFSNTSVTATIIDSNSNIVGGYSGPVTCSTDLGILQKDDEDTSAASLTISADSGRAQFALYTGNSEGTATVTCETSTLPDATMQVVFSKSAPKSHNGFGSDSVSGVGSLEIIITDDKILNFFHEEAYKTVFEPVVGGCALVEVYAYDDEGDPRRNSSIVMNITSGQASLADAYADCAAIPGSITRSLTVETNDNGRAFAFVQPITRGHKGDVEITAFDKDTSPTLTTSAKMYMATKGHAVEAFPKTSITARNDAQILANTANEINQAEILVLLLNENGKPVNDLTNKKITAKFVSGPTDGAMFVGCDDSPSSPGCDSSAGSVVQDLVTLPQVLDDLGNDITGLYSVKVLAGRSAGTLGINVGGKVISIEVTEPELDCFASSEEVGEDSISSVLCSLTTAQGIPIADETVECQIQGGDGGVDVDPTDNGTTSTGPVDMEMVDNLITPGAGWYYCQYESEDNIPSDDQITIRLTNTDRSKLPTTTVSLTASEDNPGAITQMSVIPLQRDLGPLKETSVLVLAHDADEFGIENMEVDCTNLPTTDGLLCANDQTLTNLTIIDPLEELGGGAYFFTIESLNVDDRAEFEVEAYNGSGVFVVDKEQPINVLDNTITTVRTRSEILVDGGFGGVACVMDENGIPVADLGPSDWVVTNQGAQTTRTDMREIQPATDVVGVAGSGCYNLSVDTDQSVQPGDDVHIRTALISGPTNPQDVIDVTINDVVLELMAHPSFVQSGNCVPITAIARDTDGDPIDIDTPLTNGIELEITSGGGELTDGSITAAACDGIGTGTTIMLDTDPDTDETGVYIATFEAGVLTGNTDITGRVVGGNSRAEDTVTIAVN